MSQKKLEILTDEGRRVYAKLTSDVTREILKALRTENKESGTTRSDLARIIGRDKAFITRKLSGSTNMELRTIAALCSALGYELDVNARRLCSLPNERRNFNNDQLDQASETEFQFIRNDEPLRGKNEQKMSNSDISLNEDIYY